MRANDKEQNLSPPSGPDSPAVAAAAAEHIQSVSSRECVLSVTCPRSPYRRTPFMHAVTCSIHSSREGHYDKYGGDSRQWEPVV